MLIVLGILSYFILAAIAMFWITRLDRKAGHLINDGAIYLIIAILWPVAFPIFIGFIFAHALED